MLYLLKWFQTLPLFTQFWVLVSAFGSCIVLQVLLSSSSAEEPASETSNNIPLNEKGFSPEWVEDRKS